MLINEKPDWQKEYERIRGNAVYFIEQYYNRVNPDKKEEFTDEDKQEIFNEYKRIPFYNDFDQMGRVEKKINKLREQGFKDWEIF